jgi:predicted DsbA family dithiol-disulfide isomerase
LIKYGEKVSLNMTTYRACLSGKKYTDQIKTDTVDAGKLGISGTPSFVIGRSDKVEIAGVRVVGAVPYAVFDSAIKDALATK